MIIESIGTELSRLIDFAALHMILPLFITWLIILIMQLLRRRLNRINLLVTGIGIGGIASSILLGLASLGHISESRTFWIFFTASFFVAVIGLNDIKPRKASHSKIYSFWASSWFVSLALVSLLTFIEHELGSRGPISVTIEVDEADKEDFVFLFE